MSHRVLAKSAYARGVGLLVFLALLCLCIPSPLPALSVSGYDLGWFTMDGGGGTSSGNGYILSTTIGQPDAGLLTGGSYSLASGFWRGTVAAPACRGYLPLLLR